MSDQVCNDQVGGIHYTTIDVVEDILRHVFTHLNPLHTVALLGEPGCGKTSVCKRVVRDCGYEYIAPPPLSMQEAVDLRGLSFFDHERKRTVWYPPNWMPPCHPAKWKGVMFLDEAFQADQAVQKPLGTLLVERGFDEYRIPDEARWLIASNRRTDAAGAHKILTSIINRICMIGVRVDPVEWCNYGDGVKRSFATPESAGKIVAKKAKGVDNYAAPHNINPVVRSYFGKFATHHLSTFDPLRQEPFASERSIDRLSEFLDSSPPEHIIMPYICGLIGTGVGAQFMGYMETYSKIPSIEQIAKDPKNVPMPQNDVGLLTAVTGACAAYCKALKPEALLKKKRVYDVADMCAPAEDVSNIFIWCADLPPEYALYLAKELWDVRPDILDLAGYVDVFRKKHWAIANRAVGR